MNAPVAGYRAPSPVLGNLRHVYGGRVPRRLLWIVGLCTPVILALTVGLTYALVYETDNADPGDLVAAIVMDALFALLTVVLPAMALWHRGKSVRVYEQGIEYVRGARTVPIRWDEIQRVFFTNVLVRINGISTGAQATCAFEGDSFGRIKLDHWFDGVAELGDEIQYAIHARLREQALTAWERGEPVHFGALTATREGITVGSRQLAWSAVETFHIDGGSLTVRAKGKILPWTTQRRAKLPNALVLRELADRAMRA